MKPTEYVASIRRGEDAQKMELEAMRDPFLAEALEGFEAVEGDHRANIERLEAQLTDRGKQGSARRGLIVVGVVLLLAAIIGGVVMLMRQDWSIGSLGIETTTLPAPQIETPVVQPEISVVEAIDSTILVPKTIIPPAEPIDSVALKARRIERARVRAEQKEAELRAIEAEKTQVNMAKNDENVLSDSTHKAVKSSLAPKAADSAPTKNAVKSTAQTPEPISEPSVQHAASFQGGDLARFRGWVEARVKAPNMAQASTLSKPIVISFVVNESGRLEDILVEQNPNNKLTEQVLKVIRRSPRWEPATSDGKLTRSKVTIVTRPEKWGK